LLHPRQPTASGDCAVLAVGEIEKVGEDAPVAGYNFTEPLIIAASPWQ